MRYAVKVPSRSGNQKRPTRTALRSEQRNDQSEAQRDLVARCRSESCLDRRIRLGNGVLSAKAPHRWSWSVLRPPYRRHDAANSHHQLTRELNYWKRNDSRQVTPAFSIEDLHHAIAESVAQAKAARIHPVLIERALKSAADSFAQHRAVSEPML